MRGKIELIFAEDDLSATVEFDKLSTRDRCQIVAATIHSLDFTASEMRLLAEFIQFMVKMSPTGAKGFEWMYHTTKEET